MRYFPWKWTTAALAGLALTATTAGPAAASSPSAPSSNPVVGHVYVDGNTAGANTVDGFARHSDGTLTPLPGSPFAAGGAGTGATIPSQGSTALTSNGRYLLVVDAASNQISVLRVHPDGSLSLRSISGSGGGDPVSIAIHGHLVYIANASTERPNYTGFWLRHGKLTAIDGSTVRLPDASQPGQVLFNPTGTNLVGVRVATLAHRQLQRRCRRPPEPGRGLPVRPRRARGRSAARFAPPTPPSCSSPTPMAGPATGQCRRSMWPATVR